MTPVDAVKRVQAMTAIRDYATAIEIVKELKYQEIEEERAKAQADERSLIMNWAAKTRL